MRVRAEGLALVGNIALGSSQEAASGHKLPRVAHILIHDALFRAPFLVAPRRERVRLQSLPPRERGRLFHAGLEEMAWPAVFLYPKTGRIVGIGIRAVRRGNNNSSSRISTSSGRPRDLPSLRSTVGERKIARSASGMGFVRGLRSGSGSGMGFVRGLTCLSRGALARRSVLVCAASQRPLVRSHGLSALHKNVPGFSESRPLLAASRARVWAMVWYRRINVECGSKELGGINSSCKRKGRVQPFLWKILI